MHPETDKAISNLITNSHGCRAEAAKELYRLDAEVEQLRQQLAAQTEAHEKMYAMLCKRTDELAVVTLALETENQAATMYAQQVAHWIEKHDAMKEQLADMTKDADVMDKSLDAVFRDRPGYFKEKNAEPVATVRSIEANLVFWKPAAFEKDPATGLRKLNHDDPLYTNPAPQIPEGWQLDHKFPLSRFINDANINASDSPHIVIQKLEAAMLAAAPKPEGK